MQKMLIPFMAAGVVCVAQAMTPEEACSQLFATLEKQTLVLQEVKDTASAAAAVSSLQECIDQQGKLFSVDENALWLHIDNSDEIKHKFMLILQELAAEYTRLEAASFFNCDELKSLVYTQLLSEG